MTWGEAEKDGAAQSRQPNHRLDNLRAVAQVPDDRSTGTWPLSRNTREFAMVQVMFIDRIAESRRCRLFLAFLLVCFFASVGYEWYVEASYARNESGSELAPPTRSR